MHIIHDKSTNIWSYDNESRKVWLYITKDYRRRKRSSPYKEMLKQELIKTLNDKVKHSSKM